MLLLLPWQCPELNSMDHLWREAKAKVSANRQYDDVDHEADEDERWVLKRTPRQAKCKTGMFSRNFRLLT